MGKRRKPTPKGGEYITNVTSAQAAAGFLNRHFGKGAGDRD